MIAVVGPSGSGKTTLLGALSGDLPQRGRVRSNGINPHGAGNAGGLCLYRGRGGGDGRLCAGCPPSDAHGGAD
ncbi:MAG: ATP-binding cassette domain-containing protein [Rhodobacteraceae bacterium]|nr:ATP-binding cassette domain-containing protein [Paracoccaceae bacterium]